MHELAEFLVKIRFVGLERIPPDAREDLTQRERERARQLVGQGHLKRMWRIPGRRANWGLWAAVDATQLHAILESLPYWPYMDIRIHPLARHIVDPLYGSNSPPEPEDQQAGREAAAPGGKSSVTLPTKDQRNGGIT